MHFVIKIQLHLKTAKMTNDQTPIDSIILYKHLQSLGMNKNNSHELQIQKKKKKKKQANTMSTYI